MAACFKRGHSSTPKNVTIAQKNAALDVFYGRMFKTRPKIRVFCSGTMMIKANLYRRRLPIRSPSLPSTR